MFSRVVGFVFLGVVLVGVFGFGFSVCVCVLLCMCLCIYIFDVYLAFTGYSLLVGSA